MSVRHPIRFLIGSGILDLGDQDMADKIRVTDYDVFCGIDVDAKKNVAVFVDWQDNMKRVVFPKQAEALLSYARRHFPGRRIAYVYEAGPTGYGLYDKLVGAGERCLITAPSTVARKPGERVKTNGLDAGKLALNLRGGQIEGIVVPSRLYRDLRHLVQWRNVCVKEVGRRQRRIKSLFLFEGMDFPGPRWTRAVMESLHQQEARPVVKFKLQSLLRSLKGAQKEREQADKALRRFCKRDEELNRSMKYALSVPGIGWKTASHFIARVAGCRGLTSVKSTSGFLGLGASEFSTGPRVIRGRITAVGDRALRSKLIQCAWRAIRDDPEAKEAYNKVYRSNPLQYAKQKAIVAVARLTVTRLHAVLRDQRFYCQTQAYRATRGSFPGIDPILPQSEGTPKADPEARLRSKGSRESALKKEYGGGSNSV